MEALVLPLAIGPWQIALIVVVVLLLFGGKKIPELMRGLGSGIKEFKDASKDEKNDFTVSFRNHVHNDFRDFRNSETWIWEQLSFTRMYSCR